MSFRSPKPQESFPQGAPPAPPTPRRPGREDGSRACGQLTVDQTSGGQGQGCAPEPSFPGTASLNSLEALHDGQGQWPPPRHTGQAEGLALGVYHQRPKGGLGQGPDEG